MTIATNRLISCLFSKCFNSSYYRYDFGISYVVLLFLLVENKGLRILKCLFDKNMAICGSTHEQIQLSVSEIIALELPNIVYASIHDCPCDDV